MNRELNRLNAIISNYSFEDANMFYKGFSEIISNIEDTHQYAEIEYDDGSEKIFPVELKLTGISTQQVLDSELLFDEELMVENAKAIASINDYLKERGIILLVVPAPLPFESFANRFHLSKELSTYNINRIKFMQELLMLGVETLDLEPMIEENILSDFHYFRIIEKDFHPTAIGSYYFSKYIYEHLNRYEFLNKLTQNDYPSEVKILKRVVEYQDRHFKDMQTTSLSANGTHINKQSPYLLVGDSFVVWGVNAYLAHFFKTRINQINAGGSFPSTSIMLQRRNSEISANTKVCILIGCSYFLCKRFSSIFKDSGPLLYPNKSLNNYVLFFRGKDLLDKKSSFDLALPDTLNRKKKHELLIYVNSNKTDLVYTIGVNQGEQREFRGDGDNPIILRIPLSEVSSCLHVFLSASSKNNNADYQDAALQITKIVLVELD